MDVIAIFDSFRQSLEYDHAYRVAADDALRLRVERATMSVRRLNAALAVEVSILRVQADRRAARERHVTFTVQQLLTRDVNRYERSRARGLHIHARSLQVQLVGDACSHEVFVVRDADLKSPHRLDQIGSRDEVLQEVVVDAHAREHADQTSETLRVVTGVFQRLPRTLEK